MAKETSKTPGGEHKEKSGVQASTNREGKASQSGELPKDPPQAEKTPEQWAKELGVKRSYVAGIKAYAGWKPDQRVTEEQFEKAKNKWLRKVTKAR